MKRTAQMARAGVPSAKPGSDPRPLPGKFRARKAKRYAEARENARLYPEEAAKQAYEKAKS